METISERFFFAMEIENQNADCRTAAFASAWPVVGDKRGDKGECVQNHSLISCIIPISMLKNMFYTLRALYLVTS